MQVFIRILQLVRRMIRGRTGETDLPIMPLGYAVSAY